MMVILEHIVRNEKKMNISAFRAYGLHKYTPRVWGGFDEMKLKKQVFNACHIDGEAGVDRDYSDMDWERPNWSMSSMNNSNNNTHSRMRHNGDMMEVSDSE